MARVLRSNTEHMQKDDTVGEVGITQYGSNIGNIWPLPCSIQWLHRRSLSLNLHLGAYLRASGVRVHGLPVTGGEQAALRLAITEATRNTALDPEWINVLWGAIERSVASCHVFVQPSGGAASEALAHVCLSDAAQSSSYAKIRRFLQAGSGGNVSIIPSVIDLDRALCTELLLVPPTNRQKGVGTGVMETICSMAAVDNRGVLLFAVCATAGNDSPNLRQLSARLFAFYTRIGFEPVWSAQSAAQPIIAKNTRDHGMPLFRPVQPWCVTPLSL